MIVHTLPEQPSGATVGGIWSIAGGTTCSGATIEYNIGTGFYEVKIPTTPTSPCEVVVQYTVGEDECQSYSYLTINIAIRTCLTFNELNTDPENPWQLTLEDLVIEGDVQDNYLYAVIPADDDCDDYSNAVAWAHKGTVTGCLTIPPTDGTPVVDFDSPANTTFAVPSGEYKLVVICSDYELPECTKIECCSTVVTIEDLVLCDVASGCDVVAISFSSDVLFTWQTPLMADAGKCLRLDFNGGGSVADNIGLEVLADVGMGQMDWVSVDLYLSNVDTTIDTTYTRSVVVRCDVGGGLPYMPILPINAHLFVDQYKLKWVISGSPGSNSTNWSLEMSCCDCLETCPPVINTCITLVETIASPVCATGCANVKISGLYGYTVDEILTYTGGSCSIGTTCLGTEPNQYGYSNFAGSIIHVGNSNNSLHTFSRYLTQNISVYQPYNAGLTICNAPVLKYKFNPLWAGDSQIKISITYNVDSFDYVVNFGYLDTTPIRVNSPIYTVVKNAIIGVYSGDISNIIVAFGEIFIKGTDTGCGDNNISQGTPIYFPLARDGEDVVVSYNDTDCIITFSNVFHDNVNACANMTRNAGTTKDEVFYCFTDMADKEYIGTIVITYHESVLWFLEYSLADKISLGIGNDRYAKTCPALGIFSYCIFLDVNDPINTWILISNTADTPNGSEFTIIQHSLYLASHYSTTYGLYVPIVAPPVGVNGWTNSGVTYKAVSGTTVIDYC